MIPPRPPPPPIGSQNILVHPLNFSGYDCSPWKPGDPPNARLKNNAGKKVMMIPRCSELWEFRAVRLHDFFFFFFLLAK